MTDGEFGAFGVVVGAYLGGGAIGAYLAWTMAPPVGGDFWPYIRVAAAIVGAILGAKVAILGIVLALVGVVGALSLREVIGR